MDMCASAVLSLLVEDFLASLTESQHAKLIEIYESNNPDDHSDDVAITELFSQCRTTAFWLKYKEYVEIVQQFIKAVQTNKWTLHVLVTKQILNLFAATTHSNYAKSFRLYAQSIKTLDSKHLRIYKEFILGNHTV